MICPPAEQAGAAPAAATSLRHKQNSYAHPQAKQLNTPGCRKNVRNIMGLKDKSKGASRHAIIIHIMDSFYKARWLYKMIGVFPGETVYRLARLLGISDGQVATTLCSMERHGFLVYEDDDGGLHTFGIVVN